jgi:hypothetical protein
MIKIISGFSGMGGSTEAFINLTNYLNDNGLETCFYGPHDFHLGKCNGKLINTLSCNRNDVFICHYTYNLPFINKKIIFSCHERANFFNINPIKDKIDCIHFVSKEQEKDHNIDVDSFILPNIIPPINVINRPNVKTGGVIGTIFPLKNTHISINKALEDGCKKVIIYGNIGDMNYFKDYVEPLIDNRKVIYPGWSTDKQKIYSSVTDVYHYSGSETWGYIEGECYVSGTNFHKPDSLSNFSYMKNEDIINKWIKVIND